MEQRLTFAEYLGAFRRRAWILVLTLLIGTPLAVGTAYLLPPVYLSTASILVESQQIPTELARSTVTTNTADRLELIKRRLMTREHLLEIIERLDLYADRPNMTPMAKVEKLRASTLIESQGAPSSGNRRRGPVTVSTFTIAVEANRGEEAAKIANEFVTMIIQRNQQSRNASASETNDFFKQEVERLVGDLLAIEGQISAYKRENEAAQPDSLEFRRTELTELDVRMFEREQRKFGLEEMKRGLEQTLITGEGVSGNRRLTEDERELRTLLQAYAQKSAVYAESHPTMRALNARIEALRQANNATTDGDGGTSLRESEIAQQIRVIETQLAQLAKQRVVDEARKAALDTSIVKTPEVEMALNVLYRRHSELQVQYEQLVLKQAMAETGEKLETGGQAERFEIIEQAQVPQAPVAPRRTLIAAGGIFGSFALGIALVVLAEMMNNAIRTPRDLERQLDLRPVVTIPYIRTAAEIHRRRHSLAGAMLALLVIVPGGVYALDKFYEPLPLLAERLLNSTGIDEVLRLIERLF
jgi:uncharacterized protein involved in exopolysaccharide biosynthesis